MFFSLLQNRHLHILFQEIGSEGCPTIPEAVVRKPGLVAVKLHRSVGADFTTYHDVKMALRDIYSGIFKELKGVPKPNAQALARKGPKMFQEVANLIVDGLVPESFQHFLTKPGSLMYPWQYLQEVFAAIRSEYRIFI